MRLSIAIVFLIGAMVATEVICEDDRETTWHIARVRAWFETTVKRLESGQTVKQNRQIINLVIGYTDQLLGMVSCPTTVTRRTIPRNIRNPDGVLIDRIGKVQIVLRDPDQFTRLRLHLDFILGTIEYILRGDFLRARHLIDIPKPHLPYSITKAQERDMSRVEAPTIELVVGSPSEVNLGPVVDRYLADEIIPYFIQHNEWQTATIREWLRLKVSNVAVNDTKWIFRMMECVPEIAYALVNSLPIGYFPDETLKFIGRYPVEEPDVIRGRISQIEQVITSKGTMGGTASAVLKDVLVAISHILSQDWDKAKTVIDESIQEMAVSHGVPATAAVDFRDYMRMTYQL